MYIHMCLFISLNAYSIFISKTNETMRFAASCAAPVAIGIKDPEMAVARTVDVPPSRRSYNVSTVKWPWQL